MKLSSDDGIIHLRWRDSRLFDSIVFYWRSNSKYHLRAFGDFILFDIFQIHPTQLFAENA